jgi:hypothetical protein
VRAETFSDQLKNSESNSLLYLPLKKTVGEKFEADVAIEASMSRYKPDDKDNVKNSYLTLSPSLLFKTPNLNVHAGLKPSWDNKEFKLFPKRG